MSKAVTKEQLAECLERIGDYFVQTNEDFTGASSSAAGEKGMVPAPAAGNQNKYLRGDGTWQVPANTTYSNFVKSGSGAKAGLVPAPSTTAGSTKYLCENGTWSVPAGGGGSGGGECGVKLADVTSVGYDTSPGKVTVTWTDPSDVTYQNASIARWAGTKLVRKVGSAPANESDGTVVKDSKTRNQYKTTGFVDSGLTDGTSYYYRFFPYTDVGTHTKGTSFNATPNKIATTMTVTKTGDAYGVTGTAVQVGTITTDGDGQLTATSSNTNVGTVSISNKKVYVTPKADGTITVTVNQLAGINYSSAGPKTISVTVAVMSTTLNNNTPAKIQYAAQHDLASSLWDIGDYFEMTLNGNWQCTDNVISLSNYKIRCILIGINHNADKEGNHLLHFQMGKNTNNVDVGFNYSKINSEYTNSGGWKSCKMRTITMTNLYNTIIPSNWRAVIKPCTKYTDNTGGSNADASYVTATSDNCFLLAEYEVFGNRTYANSAEQNYQKQYAYYANGNSKVRYMHDSPTITHGWHARSVWENSMARFCGGRKSGEADWHDADSGYYCFSPVFCIG